LPIQISLRDESAEAPPQRVLPVRPYPRLPIQAQVTFARVGIPTRTIARSRDLSWDGASLLVPQETLDLDDALVLEFPWRDEGSFSAHAKVAWKQRIDDQHYLAGVSFTRLSVSDEEKLRQLLSMLVRVNASEHDTSVANALRISFLDRGEMLAALEQIRHGSIETTLFQPVKTNERFPLDVTGFSDLPSLCLRARILWHKAFCSEEGPRSSGVFQVALALDHSDNDLKRVTDPLIERLKKR